MNTIDLTDQNPITIDKFIKEVNSLRLDSKGKDSLTGKPYNIWYVFTAYVYSENQFSYNLVEIKGYGTWLQIFKVNLIKQNTLMDISVKKFKKTLIKGVS